MLKTRSRPMTRHDYQYQTLATPLFPVLAIPLEKVFKH